MSRMRRLLSVLVAAFMLLTLPMTTGIARTLAEGTTEPTEQTEPSEGIVLETEEIDPATLHVHKLGEIEEEEEPGAFDPETLEPVIDLNQIVRVSVFLDGKSTIDAGYDTQGIAENRGAVAYRNQLRKQQDAMQTKIEQAIGHKLTVKWNLTLLVNAISVEIPYKDIVTIQRIPGVKSVELETQYEAPEPVEGDQPNTAVTSTGMVGAQEAWANGAGYTGAGSRIAIIDTGLDTDHQSFNEDAFNYAISQVRATGKTVNLMTSIPSGLNGSGRRISAKIPYAYNYVDNNTTVNHTNDTQGEHGSHVSGIATANRFLKSGSSYVDAASTVGAVGMAPDAQILVMKVFGSGGGAYDSDYFSALEDAITLGADAANLSLGSSAPGFTFNATSSYQTTLNNLVNNSKNNHLVVSISAGNNGSFDQYLDQKLYAEDAHFHTGGSPGSFVNSMGTAAAQNIGTIGAPLVYNGQNIFYSETDSTGAKMKTVPGTYNFVYIDAPGNTSDYSTVNSAVSLSGKIVMVNRGDISFYVKGNNLKTYSPKALIVVNNQEGTINMALDDYTGTFPMVSILLSEGEMIKATATKHTTGGIDYYTGSITVTSTIQQGLNTTRENAAMATFSSWGVPGSLLMKPEITAPGGSIYSVAGYNKTSSGYSGGHDAYELMSGTSMAAPHMAGLSGIVAQFIRENGNFSDTSKTLYNTELTSSYNVRAIMQSLLMSTATPMKPNGSYLAVMQQGAGLAEVNRAVNAKSVIMMDQAGLTTKTGANTDGKVKVELGDDPHRTGEYTYSFKVFNLTDKELSYTLSTDLFTQAIDGANLSHGTVMLPSGGVTYNWITDYVPEGHDVDMDGDTDDNDAQAILDYLTGEKAASEVDLTVADLDEDGTITSHDAHLLLNWAAGAGPSGYVIPAHSKANVTVTINLTAAQRAVFEARECGGYLEGYTYVTCTTADQEGVSYAHEHSIPILGYYGSWTDPTMFDTNSYIEQLYGNTQKYYSEAVTDYTNYLTIQASGSSSAKLFAGNPYVVEDTFPEDRLAIRSDATISAIIYNLIRNAGATGYAVSAVDEDGNVTSVKSATVTATNVVGQYYNESSAAWVNTAKKTYSPRALVSSYGFSEGDRARIGFYAIPEYNAMVVKNSYNATNSGTLTTANFQTLLLSNVLGKGAMVGYDFYIDNTAPTFGTITKNDEEAPTAITVNVVDNCYIAYLTLKSVDGNTTYGAIVPEQTAANQTVTYTFSIPSGLNGSLALFAGDYAGNETAVQVKLNDNEPETVYVLTNTVTAGKNYLIMSRNTAGTGYGLYYTLNASQTTATAGAFSVQVKAGTADTNGRTYIESSGVNSQGIWTAGTGSTSGTYTFNNNGWYLRRSNSNALTITKDASRRDWTWDSANNRLSINSRYLRYYNNTFSISTTANSVYLFEETLVYGSNAAEPVEDELIETPEVPEDIPEEPEAIDEEPVEEPAEPETEEPIEPKTEEPIEEPEEPAEDAPRAIVGTATSGTVAFSESAASTNGVFEVGYNTSELTCTGTAKGTAANLFVSVHLDAATGKIKVAYAMKGEDALAASTTIATGTFTSQSCEEKNLTVATTERGESYHLTESETVAIDGLGHDWGTPTWTWTGNDADGYTAATATFVCTRDSSHTETVAATVTSAENDACQTVYTATATFDGVDYTETKTVGITAYYLIGSMTNWQVDPAYRFTPNGSTAGEFILSTNLAINDQIKVVQATGTTAGTWYPADYGNYYVDYAHSGSVNIYFRPAGNGDWWSFHSGGFFYISKLHTVTVVTDGNGTATLVPETPDITATVYVTTTPNDGYHYDRTELYKRTGAGENDLELITLDWNEANKTFTMPDFDVVIKVCFAAHTYGEASYVWSIDNSSVTATHTCTACGAEESETVTATSAVTKQATCEEAGETTYTATFTKEGFTTQTKIEANIPATGHAYGEPTYTWTADNSSVTATRVCANDASHIETETVSTSYAVTAAADCETAGVGTYTATFTNTAFVTQTKTETIPATGHDWTFADFTWTGDDTNGYTAAVANYVCSNDSTHTQTVAATLTSETTDGTCTNPGQTVYTATVAAGSSPDGSERTDSKTVVIASSGHAYGEPTYTWAADNSSVTATRVCANDASHIETETVSTSYAVTTAADCENAGVGTYTATFTNTAFVTQTKTEAIPATGHDWTFVDFTWTGDDTNGYTAAVANYVCSHDAEHTRTENATVTSATTDATCEAAGQTVYTATEGEHTDSKTVAIPAIGHNWTFVDFTWTETADGWTAVANYVCGNDAEHTKTETATVTSETTDATCEAAGQTVYTATENGHTDTKTVVIEALGHDWTFVDFTWTGDDANGYTAAVANYVCSHDAEHTKTENATVTSATTDATCEEAGQTVYTATEGEHTDTRTVAIPAIGHAWGTPAYTWAEDNSSVTASRVCANDPTHVEAETVNTTYQVTTEPTFNTVGEGVYTAAFTNPAFEQQTRTVEIPKLTESATVAYVDFRHGKTLQVFVVEIKADEDTPTPVFTAYDEIGEYADCRYNAADMWTTAVAENVTADTIYVLKWINVYTVTFLDANGDAIKTVSVDENGVIPASEIPAPEKEGYTVDGWNESDLAFDVTQPITRNITLTPVYKINTYTVTFVNNGETYLEVAVDHGATLTVPEQPTNGNKVFDGWYADGTEEAFDFETPITGNMTLTAHWSDEVIKIGTRITFADGAVLYNNATPYVIWKGTAETPAFTVEGEDDTTLSDSDYTFTYLRNDEPGTGYIRVTVTNAAYSNPADGWFKIYLPASASLTVENIKEGIQLTWAPVDGAAGYVIYRRAWSTTTNGWTSFERWWNVTDTTWIDGSDASHKVYAGTRYQYGVKAYFGVKTDDVADKEIGGNLDNYNLGIVSPLKTTVRITTRTLTSVASAESGKLTVKWSGSKVFTGYQVQIATDDRFENIVKDEKIASAATYSKVYDGLTSGTTYYVRIRSYHLFGGMTYYGEWSNVKSGIPS